MIVNNQKSGHLGQGCDQDVLSKEVNPILRSDEEKELVRCHREEQRKLDVENISETIVKNVFYLLRNRVLKHKIISE